MVLIAMIFFVVSLVGITALFGVKYWELKHSRVLWSEWRAKNDSRALHLKDLAFAARSDVQDLLPRAVIMARILLHEAALSLARMARFSERQAHRLADMVSHKRGFERRETRSEFLRKVSEGRNDVLDTTNENGHNS